MALELATIHDEWTGTRRDPGAAPRVGVMARLDQLEAVIGTREGASLADVVHQLRRDVATLTAVCDDRSQRGGCP
jgi:hypothetical protein